MSETGDTDKILDKCSLRESKHPHSCFSTPRDKTMEWHMSETGDTDKILNKYSLRE